MNQFYHKFPTNIKLHSYQRNITITWNEAWSVYRTQSGDAPLKIRYRPWKSKENRLDKCKCIWESESSLNGTRSNNRIDKRWSTLEIIDSRCSLCFDSFCKRIPLYSRSYSQTTLLYTKERRVLLSCTHSRLIMKFYTKRLDTDRRLGWIACAD